MSVIHSPSPDKYSSRLDNILDKIELEEPSSDDSSDKEIDSGKTPSQGSLSESSKKESDSGEVVTEKESPSPQDIEQDTPAGVGASVETPTKDTASGEIPLQDGASGESPDEVTFKEKESKEDNKINEKDTDEKESSEEDERKKIETETDRDQEGLKEFEIYSDDVDVTKKIEEEKKNESTNQSKALTNGELLANELKKEAANLPQQNSRDQVRYHGRVGRYTTIILTLSVMWWTYLPLGGWVQNTTT